MSEQPQGQQARAVDAADLTRRRQLGVVGLSVVIVGLLLLIVGVFLGLWLYNSPLEQSIRRGLALSTSSLSGMQLEGGGTVVSVEPYRVPGPASYVFSEPATWLGIVVAAIGFGVYLRSIAHDVRLEADPEAVSLEIATIHEAIGSQSDEPFDTGDE